MSIPGSKNLAPGAAAVPHEAYSAANAIFDGRVTPEPSVSAGVSDQNPEAASSSSPSALPSTDLKMTAKPANLRRVSVTALTARQVGLNRPEHKTPVEPLTSPAAAGTAASNVTPPTSPRPLAASSLGRSTGMLAKQAISPATVTVGDLLELFHEAQKCIMTLMQTDSWFRFQQSHQFSECVRNLRQRPPEPGVGTLVMMDRFQTTARPLTERLGQPAGASNAVKPAEAPRSLTGGGLPKSTLPIDSKIGADEAIRPEVIASASFQLINERSKSPPPPPALRKVSFSDGVAGGVTGHSFGTADSAAAAAAAADATSAMHRMMGSGLPAESLLSRHIQLNGAGSSFKGYGQSASKIESGTLAAASITGPVTLPPLPLFAQRPRKKGGSAEYTPLTQVSGGSLLPASVQHRRNSTVVTTGESQQLFAKTSPRTPNTRLSSFVSGHGLGLNVQGSNHVDNGLPASIIVSTAEAAMPSNLHSPSPPRSPTGHPETRLSGAANVSPTLSVEFPKPSWSVANGTSSERVVSSAGHALASTPMSARSSGSTTVQPLLQGAMHPSAGTHVGMSSSPSSPIMMTPGHASHALLSINSDRSPPYGSHGLAPDRVPSVSGMPARSPRATLRMWGRSTDRKQIGLEKLSSFEQQQLQQQQQQQQPNSPGWSSSLLSESARSTSGGGAPADYAGALPTSVSNALLAGAMNPDSAINMLMPHLHQRLPSHSRHSDQTAVQLARQNSGVAANTPHRRTDGARSPRMPLHHEAGTSTPHSPVSPTSDAAAAAAARLRARVLASPRTSGESTVGSGARGSGTPRHSGGASPRGSGGSTTGTADRMTAMRPTAVDDNVDDDLLGLTASVHARARDMPFIMSVKRANVFQSLKHLKSDE